MSASSLVTRPLATLKRLTEYHAKITATDGHPFWVPALHQWIEAGDLQAGQSLQTSAGT
ncbi:hypothetical protein [Streptomyces sp. NPDC029554]|uniref:hypothetical protein n=1 Tax=Streptomyces sp. NPDC029554 TaxID=3155126 RepID=UPI0033CEB86E